MDAKTLGIIDKFKKNQELAQKIMSGSDGQQLMQLLSGLMQSPEGAKLMQRLNDTAKK